MSFNKRVFLNELRNYIRELRPSPSAEFTNDLTKRAARALDSLHRAYADDSMIDKVAAQHSLKALTISLQSKLYSTFITSMLSNNQADDGYNRGKDYLYNAVYKAFLELGDPQATLIYRLDPVWQNIFDVMRNPNRSANTFGCDLDGSVRTNNDIFTSPQPQRLRLEFDESTLNDPSDLVKAFVDKQTHKWAEWFLKALAQNAVDLEDVFNDFYILICVSFAKNILLQSYDDLYSKFYFTLKNQLETLKAAIQAETDISGFTNLIKKHSVPLETSSVYDPDSDAYITNMVAPELKYPIRFIQSAHDKIFIKAYYSTTHTLVQHLIQPCIDKLQNCKNHLQALSYDSATLVKSDAIRQRFQTRAGLVKLLDTTAEQMALRIIAIWFVENNMRDVANNIIAYNNYAIVKVCSNHILSKLMDTVDRYLQIPNKYFMPSLELEEVSEASNPRRRRRSYRPNAA